MAENVTSLICSSPDSNANTQIILSALAIVGTLVSAMTTYCLKRPGVQSLVGLGSRAEKKKALHDAVKVLIPQLESLAQQLSGKSDSPDNSAASPSPKKDKIAIDAKV
jgi:hypothetical protein